MNQPTKILLRSLGFARPTPATRLGRYFRRAERSAAVLAVFYLALQLFPQVLFAHCATAEGITFYARTPLPADVAGCALAREN